MITSAIVLAAGEGSRLQSVAPFKPLCRVAGRTLLEHALLGLAEAGLKRVVVVLGYGAEHVTTHIEARGWPLVIETVTTTDFRAPNGTSVLAAQPLVGGEEVLLAMCDHLVDPALYRLVGEAGARSGACLGVDHRLKNEFVDLDDVTRVQTEGDRISAISKGLIPYDCFDTGVFAVGSALFDALHGLDSPSLTEGMRTLAAAGTALTVDCGDLVWIDVDDHVALKKAEHWAAS